MRYFASILLSAALLGSATSAVAVPIFSSQERAEGLRQGLGMGLAKPADNNGYPGPRHVLDAADKLQLTAEQRQRITQLVAQMKTEAIPAATKLLADEAALEQLFVDKGANPENIAAAAKKAAESQAAVQTIHLRYHLLTRDLLTPAQIAQYAALQNQPMKAPSPSRSPAMMMPGHDMSDHHH
jgi:Spy/CpxP family protein refolding chaperone